jgi:phosphoribosylaminoimidazole-succinocarboxamide synthase
VADIEIPEAPVVEGARHVHSGKVRDLYELTSGEHAGRLLMVASDRISAYDFVLDTTIPDKGEILTRMSLWWFDQLTDLVPNHVVSTDVPESVRGRAVVCARLAMLPVE